MTIGELRALPVGREHIGELRYLPVGVAPTRGPGRGRGRDVTASIARIGIKLPQVEQIQETRVVSVPKEELESLKPIFSENPWVKNDYKRNQLIEKLRIFKSGTDEETDSAPEVDPDAPEVDRNSVKRTQLRRELDEVLRGIREMGGVGAICREREGGGESGEGEVERRKELRRQEKLWMIPKPKVEDRGPVERAFEDLLKENEDRDEYKNNEEDEDEIIRQVLETEEEQIISITPM
ncbi:uncharacterized protein LOC111700285 [Eurytemora carolleeae]|uniref:uncharacterized protein LOC111700285 n=1 Tax=Eurytemora carolleeae TaxID=1294199 RepID=UPI000C75D46E|nr:uncharacterized protein LOC111700285 [Eurytemora carolleeae]|eukprot:XP_023326924.1 uncharacterized protein LOC111700285 [Eurytemora affinis]